MEIAGFSLVAYELFRTQRREFGDPKILKAAKASRIRFQGRVRKLLRRPAAVTDLSAELSGTLELTGTLKAKRRRGRGKTMEEHLAALEENFALLDQEVEDQCGELEKAIEDVRGELRNTQAELERQRREREDEERSFRQEFVPLQWLGIGLFVVGAFSSGVANVVSCS